MANFIAFIVRLEALCAPAAGDGDLKNMDLTGCLITEA